LQRLTVPTSRGVRNVEKDVHRTDRNVPLFAGEDIPHPDPDSPFAEVGTNVHLEQMKDMLMTYNEYNKELGYVQGMSDLLAPIYAVMQDDAIAFWGFQKFMERMVGHPVIFVLAEYTKLISFSGTQLPPRPIRHASATHNTRPARPTHGSQALSPPSVRRQHELLLLLPHAAGLVQARIPLGRCAIALGTSLDRHL